MGQCAGEGGAETLQGRHAGGVEAEGLAREVVGGERQQAFLEDQARGEAAEATVTATADTATPGRRTKNR